METLPMIQSFDYEDHPIHIFDHQGKVAFLAQEVANVIGIKNLTKSIRSSDHMTEGEDYLVIPSNSIDLTNRELITYGKKAPKVTILFESGFYKFVLRSTKPLANSFFQWVCNGALPGLRQMIYQNKEKLPHTALMGILAEERKGSLYARKILNDYGYNPAPKLLPEPKDGDTP